MNKWQYLPRDLWFLKWKALGASSPLAVFGRLRTSSEDFGLLRKTSDVFGRLRTSSGIFGNDRVVFKNPSTPRIKISRLYLRKSWRVYKWWTSSKSRRKIKLIEYQCRIQSAILIPPFWPSKPKMANAICCSVFKTEKLFKKSHLLGNYVHSNEIRLTLKLRRRSERE